MTIPDKPILTGTQLHNYLPHRPPMVFVDTFYGTSDESQYSSLLITPEQFLVENGELLEVGLLEFMTQSGYIWFSYREKVILNKTDKEITKGYLCKIKNTRVTGTPRVGERIYSKLDVGYFSTAFNTLHITAYTNDRVLAEGDFDVLSLN